ncbi:glycerophosphoryl diester phosphodiesterase membrane domain-containing protein [Cronbergia sp. UHCC 0137]|uniref:glycerophosphoryl diester phosphodiesterase membrane domain-containing protein n=1 Tax=Cronbergia sp. UHCC 0137 TaxID=3110239 RepID=UPI002B207881|nr:glycerophosphoryl diester phosphodiesterase membrane domain-containing protein [Cronbergia sp. UHCC 0137]MEA5617889.1 glycerophosphoryl diester phosphodiesterase membrane domain-containing protein [Cronbergia sp. UHCC 0137]
MSQNFGSSNPTQPLSVGNVVSAGLQLYRSHLKEYFLLALRAYIWVLVPVYGWAKCYALAALISRLAFGELVNQPESIKSGERFVNSRIWKFLGLLLLMFLIGIGIVIGFVILFGIVSILSAGMIGSLGQQINPLIVVVFALIAIGLSIIMFVGFLWLMTRFYLVDLPLAIEENVDATSTISRSWELTKGNIGRILLISFVSVLITFPFQIIIQIITSIIQVIFAPLLDNGNPVFSLLFFVLVLGISFAGSAVVLPFLQTVKAVVYYDLRSRREGLGLQLRDREI